MDENFEEIPEHCWEERYRNASRPWLLALRKPIDPNLKSEAGASYVIADVGQRESELGARKELLKKQLFEQVYQELIDEQNKAPPVEEYCTEYDGNFYGRKSGKSEKSDNEEEIKELCLKHPLYSSEPMTYWAHKLKSALPGMCPIQGVTPTPNLNHPFRRCNKFSKPIWKILDEPPSGL